MIVSTNVGTVYPQRISNVIRRPELKAMKFAIDKYDETKENVRKKKCKKKKKCF